jgi:membrane associated rhomboid family serine protease
LPRVATVVGVSTARRAPSTTSSWGAALTTIGLFVVLLYAIELVDTMLANRLDMEGVQPREPEGLVGIAFAPLLHGGWGHLLANTVPTLVLGFLVLVSNLARGLAVTAVVWVVGGLGIWVVAPPGTVHIGASVLIFGWLVYLIVRGFFSRRPGQILLGLVVLFLYGGALWGVLPGQPGVSWQGHLFGAVGGALAAWLFAEPRRRRARPDW